MSLKTQILGKGNKDVAHLHKKNGDTGLLVFTDPFREYIAVGRPFLNDTFGAEMNVNAAFSGTPEIVHDGTDTTAWTGSQIQGTKVTFDSTDRANGGTKSVKVDNPNTTDTWQFDKGSNLTVSSYAAVTFSINIDKDWTSGDSISLFGWDTGTAAVVGNLVLIEDYFDEFTFDVWHSVVIPLSDLGLTSGTIDAIRMEQVGKNGKAAKLYIDDLKVQETGVSAKYTITPSDGTILHMSKLVFSWADVGTAGTAHAYDKIGALSALTNGIVLQTQSRGETIFSATFNQLSDMLDAGAVIENLVDDGTNTFMTASINLFETEPVFLDSRDNDEFSVTINDDLSGLLHFITFARGREEVIK